jgi:type VI protein secretion system component Hcp
MAEGNRDLLMKIIVKGVPVDTESPALVESDDTLAKGFVPAAAGKRANYSSIETFQLELGLMGERDADAPEDEAAAARRRQEAQEEHMRQLLEAKEQDADALRRGPVRSAAEYKRFMRLAPGGSLKGGRTGARGFAANLDTLSITKRLDLASLALFKACINSTRLDRAVLIKRRAIGGQVLRAFARFEFEDLLITDFNWEDGEVVEETIKFVCRKATVQYSMEKPGGGLAPPGEPGVWRVGNLTGRPSD